MSSVDYFNYYYEPSTVSANIKYFGELEITQELLWWKHKNQLNYLLMKRFSKAIYLRTEISKSMQNFQYISFSSLFIHSIRYVLKWIFTYHWLILHSNHKSIEKLNGSVVIARLNLDKNICSKWTRRLYGQTKMFT